MTADRNELLLSLLAKQLDDAGLDLADLASHLSGDGPATGPNLAEVAPGALKHLTPSTRRSRASSIAWLLEGDATRCFSVRCATRPGKAGSNGLVPGCGCGERCTCSAGDFPDPDIGDCSARWDGLGHVPVRAVTTQHLLEFMTTARWRARLRNAVRDRRRAQRGAKPYRHKGEYTDEQNRGLLKQIFEALEDDGHLQRNPALKLKNKTRRPRRRPTGLSSDELLGLWAALHTGSAVDIELDPLLLRTILIAGSRRGGVLNLVISDLMFHTSSLRLSEKFETEMLQPVPYALLEDLLAHALERGPFAEMRAMYSIDELVSAVLSGDVTVDGDAPVFYLRPRRRDGASRPVTHRHIETLFAKLRSDLPWADERQLRPHDLRRTSGTMVERIAGGAVAKAFLRHAPADPSDLYTAATMDEVRDAVERFTNVVDDDGSTSTEEGG